jgi:hypothetical protein
LERLSVHGKLGIILSLFSFNSFAIVANCMRPITTRHIPMLRWENIASSRMALAAAFTHSRLLSVLYALASLASTGMRSHFLSLAFTSSRLLSLAFTDTLTDSILYIFYLYAGTRGKQMSTGIDGMIDDMFKLPVIICNSRKNRFVWIKTRKKKEQNEINSNRFQLKLMSI